MMMHQNASLGVGGRREREGRKKARNDVFPHVRRERVMVRTSAGGNAREGEW
jgi:hypothetical protein